MHRSDRTFLMSGQLLDYRALDNHADFFMVRSTGGLKLLRTLTL